LFCFLLGASRSFAFGLPTQTIQDKKSEYARTGPVGVRTVPLERAWSRLVDLAETRSALGSPPGRSGIARRVPAQPGAGDRFAADSNTVEEARKLLENDPRKNR